MSARSRRLKVSNRSASSENATGVTLPGCPVSLASCNPEVAFQTAALPLALPVAT